MDLVPGNGPKPVAEPAFLLVVDETSDRLADLLQDLLGDVGRIGVLQDRFCGSSRKSGARTKARSSARPRRRSGRGAAPADSDGSRPHRTAAPYS